MRSHTTIILSTRTSHHTHHNQHAHQSLPHQHRYHTTQPNQNHPNTQSLRNWGRLWGHTTTNRSICRSIISFTTYNHHRERRHHLHNRLPQPCTGHPHTRCRLQHPHINLPNCHNRLRPRRHHSRRNHYLHFTRSQHSRRSLAVCRFRSWKTRRRNARRLFRQRSTTSQTRTHQWTLQQPTHSRQRRSLNQPQQDHHNSQPLKLKRISRIPRRRSPKGRQLKQSPRQKQTLTTKEREPYPRTYQTKRNIPAIRPIYACSNATRHRTKANQYTKHIRKKNS